MPEKSQEKNHGRNQDRNHEKAAEKPSGEDKVVLAKAEYDALKARADERDAFYDKYVRAHAEFENVRKRLEKEKSDFAKYANESFVFELLPIIDNLEIAERHIKEAKDFGAVRDGVDMIQAQIQAFLKDIGLERVKAVGERFDPNVHEAVETEESKDKEDGLVAAELKPGYRLNGRLLRPALVRIVTRKQ